MRKRHYGSTFNGYALSKSFKNNEGFYVEALQNIEELMKHVTKVHARVFFSMFSLTYPANSILKYQEDNVLISKFFEALMRYYQRHDYHPYYLWARELSTSGQPHYHFVIFTDANKVQNGYVVLKKATELWQGCLGIADGRGLVHLCTSGECAQHYNDQYGGVKIMRNDANFDQVFGACFQRASYLAKRYSKDGLPANTNGFGGSRIPKNTVIV